MFRWILFTEAAHFRRAKLTDTFNLAMILTLFCSYLLTLTVRITDTPTILHLNTPVRRDALKFSHKLILSLQV